MIFSSNIGLCSTYACYYEKVGNNAPVRLENLAFDIPDSWCWARLGNAVIVNPRNDLSDELTISFVSMKDIQEGFTNQFYGESKPWRQVKSGFTHFANDDVAFAKITPCFQNRKSVVFTDLENGYGAGTTELHILRAYPNTIMPQFLLCLVKTSYFIEYGKEHFSGTAGQQRFGTEEVKNLLAPIPPYAEQERICKRVEQLFSII